MIISFIDGNHGNHGNISTKSRLFNTEKSHVQKIYEKMWKLHNGIVDMKLIFFTTFKEYNNKVVQKK